jgi:hypothetical protein
MFGNFFQCAIAKPHPNALSEIDNFAISMHSKITHHWPDIFQTTAERGIENFRLILFPHRAGVEAVEAIVEHRGVHLLPYFPEIRVFE